MAKGGGQLVKSERYDPKIEAVDAPPNSAGLSNESAPAAPDQGES